METDRDELIEKINELNTRIEELTTPPHNDWHSWFYALLMILLNKFDSVDVDREVMLGIQAPRADFIVVNEDKSVDLGLKIFSLFDKHNVAEFKSPDDALNMFTLWKGIGYVGFYLNHVKEKGKDIDISEVTLSFFRETKPDALFKELGDHIVDGPAKGIYYIKNWLVDIPIQIIVTRELEGDEYAGFRAISKKPKEEDVVAFMKKHGKESEVSSFVRAYADGVSKVDSDLMELFIRCCGHQNFVNLFKGYIFFSALRSGFSLCFYAAGFECRIGGEHIKHIRGYGNAWTYYECVKDIEGDDLNITRNGNGLERFTEKI